MGQMISRVGVTTCFWNFIFEKFVTQKLSEVQTFTDYIYLRGYQSFTSSSLVQTVSDLAPGTKILCTVNGFVFDIADL